MRKPPKVDLTDAAAVAAWLTETRTLAAQLHALTVDATAPKPQRRHSRAFLRVQTRRHFQTLGALFAALDPAPLASPES